MCEVQNGDLKFKGNFERFRELVKEVQNRFNGSAENKTNKNGTL